MVVLHAQTLVSGLALTLNRQWQEGTGATLAVESLALPSLTRAGIEL